MPDSKRTQQSLTAKVFTVSAIGMGIGFGSCGLGFITAGGPVGLSRIMIPAGAILFFVSLATLVITALIALATRIVESLRK